MCPFLCPVNVGWVNLREVAREVVDQDRHTVRDDEERVGSLDSQIERPAEGRAGIEHATSEASASYLQHWIRKLKGDPKLAVQAAGAAQKAADFILGEGQALAETA